MNQRYACSACSPASRRWSFNAMSKLTDSIEPRLGCLWASKSERCCFESGLLWSSMLVDRVCGDPSSIPSTTGSCVCVHRRLQPVKPCCVDRGKAMERELSNHAMLANTGSGPFRAVVPIADGRTGSGSVESV